MLKPKSPQKAEPLNEEVLKGVWVDGIGVLIGPDYIILEGVITKPRSDKPYIVSRMMFPARIFENFVQSLNQLLKEAKEKAVKKAKEKAVKK